MTEKSESLGVDQEGSTARTEAPASNQSPHYCLVCGHGVRLPHSHVALPVTPEERAAERAQDALVAEKIMGLEVWRTPSVCGVGEDAFLVIDGGTDYAPEYEIPRYSEDIAAAFAVLEKMAGWKIEFPAKMSGLGSPKPLYRVRVWARDKKDYREWNGAGLPSVICTAALDAVGA